MYAFQLFSGGPTEVDLVEKKETFDQKRPDSYYFFEPSSEDVAKFQSAAVTGEFILTHAKPIENPVLAPDINAEYRKPKKSRPGKQARSKRRERKAMEKEIKERHKQFGVRYKDNKKNGWNRPKNDRQRASPSSNITRIPSSTKPGGNQIFMFK